MEVEFGAVRIKLESFVVKAEQVGKGGAVSEPPNYTHTDRIHVKYDTILNVINSNLSIINKSLFNHIISVH